MRTVAEFRGPLRFYGLALAVGVVGGLGAVVFRGLIALFHNLFFLGHFSVFYDANVHTAAESMGRVGDFGAGDRRHWRGFPGD